jgi:hypothetical protein
MMVLHIKIPTRCPHCDKLEPCGGGYCASVAGHSPLMPMLDPTWTPRASYSHAERLMNATD